MSERLFNLLYAVLLLVLSSLGASIALGLCSTYRPGRGRYPLHLEHWAIQIPKEAPRMRKYIKNYIVLLVVLWAT